MDRRRTIAAGLCLSLAWANHSLNHPLWNGKVVCVGPVQLLQGATQSLTVPPCVSERLWGLGRLIRPLRGTRLVMVFMIPFPLRSLEIPAANL